ncbi:MAG: hypothetical protein V5A37_02915 [Halobacteriales archaeon]
MAETRFAGIEGERLRYGDADWELTGEIELRQRGDVVMAKAVRTDGGRGERANLSFGIADPPGSLNPGNLGDPEAWIEGPRGEHELVVRTDRRTYRYELHSIEH